jgi:hypothetical protein
MFSVKKVEGDHVYLNVGKVRTVCDQTVFAIYPKYTEDFTSSDPLAYVALTTTLGLYSTATFVKGTSAVLGGWK